LAFAGAVLNPPIYWDVFDNNSVQLRSTFDRFSAALTEQPLLFSLYLAAGYFVDEHFLTLIEHDDLLALQVGEERLILFEFSPMQGPWYLDLCLSALAARGYQPVIAHVERYRFVEPEPSAWFDRFA
jgi:tyrosine-protein phosphatase YwqE